MKMLVFTEGTLLMHRNGLGVPREERVRQVQRGDPSLRDWRSYVPIGGSPEKLWRWRDQGAQIFYMTSRKAVRDIEDIREVLKVHGFPSGELIFRDGSEGYGDVAERLMPDVLIEDDCESIGGETEMTYSRVSAASKRRIKLIKVREFGGVDHLPDSLSELMAHP